MPERIVTYSTGNHAIALAYAAELFRLKIRIYLPKNVINYKRNILKTSNLDIIEVGSRAEAEYRSMNDINNDFHFVHPSSEDMIISGAGTVVYEAIKQFCHANPEDDLDFIFAPCGGGGLLSGSLLARDLISPCSRIFGCEPLVANDAYLSIKNNKIYRFEKSPITIAAGLRALTISQKIITYLKK